MKSKLLFTAALMSAMTGTAQVTWVDVMCGVSME